MDQRQGLLCLIATVETQDHGPGTPDHGPCASVHGPLVLVAWIHLGMVLFGCARISIRCTLYNLLMD